jgi:Cu(I)/Ag(I) efflux system membrane fusion protein
MSEPNAYRRLGPIDNGAGRDISDEGSLRAPPGLGPLGKSWWWFRFVVLVKLARLRFLAILAAIGGVIAYWDTINAYYEKWTRPLFGAETTVSSDTEYWCPMHPTVVRDHPDKCPICHMALAKRKKGDKNEDEALPPGVSRRVQLTPYKVAVADIDTAEVGYRKLTKEINAVGYVEFDETTEYHVVSRQRGRIVKLFVNYTGQKVKQGEKLATIDVRYSPDLMVSLDDLRRARRYGDKRMEDSARQRLHTYDVDDAHIEAFLKSGKIGTEMTIVSPNHGHVIKKYQREGSFVEDGTPLYDVADLSTVWIEAQVYEDELAFLKEEQPVAATTKEFPNREFKGKVEFIHPHLDAATRTLKVRFSIDNPRHELRPGAYATVRLSRPVVSLPLMRDERRQQWAEQTTAELTMQALASAGVPKMGGGLSSLLTAATDEAIAGGDLVLAVPETAVIDTGSRQFVYRESEPDTFDQLEVQLGPRCGGYYPVMRGLRPGDRVATTGSLLIDAETRLSGGAASTYFGASGGLHSDRSDAATPTRPSMTRDDDAKFQAMLKKLNSEDRALVEAQGYCPVLGNRLGSMGPTVPVELSGQKVFVCCKVCVNKARANEKRTLAKLAELKARIKSGARPAPSSSPSGPALPAKVRANLAKLSAEDRRLAEEQKYCPIETANLLGKMGVPVVIDIKGQKVFLCCAACKDDALADPDQTLAKVKELKAKAGKRE